MSDGDRSGEPPEAGGRRLLRDGERPAAPRPAATVILLRRSGRHRTRGLEVCLVRRNPQARFMPGVWVFPGGAVDPGDGDGEDGHRAAAARELAEEASIAVDPAELVPYSRWITPRLVPVRFDTRFYLALAPPHTPPTPDGAETVEAGWFSPRLALDRHATGDMGLVFPTIRHLESLLGFADAREALSAAASRVVKPIEPEIVGDGEQRRIVVPGED